MLVIIFIALIDADVGGDGGGDVDCNRFGIA
jgi:hypothetical protein